MVSALVSGLGGAGSITGRGHCVAFSAHPGKQMDTRELNYGGNPAID